MNKKVTAMTNAPIAPPYQLSSTRHGTMLANSNDVYMGQAFLRYGECCEIEIRLLLSLLKIPGMVIEVGANMGVHTVPMATELARQGRSMLALEPQPIIFQQLCANLAINGLLNVSALSYACGKESGVVSFEVPDYRSRGNFGGTSMCARPTTPTRHETVPCIRLDDLVPTAAVGLIKIDVEGYELQVLEGSSDIIARSNPVLYVENDRVNQSPQLIQWLFDHNYQLWWHLPPLFNPENFFEVKENIYPNIHSSNMLCIPKLSNLFIKGLTRVADPFFHPFAPRPATDLQK
jgi:FkbM family methyltransferase